MAYINGLDGRYRTIVRVADVGDQIVFGGALTQVIVGSSGEDRLYGDFYEDSTELGAGDVLLGMAIDLSTSRTITSSANLDSIKSGRDWLFGDDGADAIYGGQGNDVIEGGKGNDGSFLGDKLDIRFINVDDLKDAEDELIPPNLPIAVSFSVGLFGGSGNDDISGGDGSDVLYGEKDNDYLRGDSGSDVVWGGTGSDRIEGGSGSDALFGDDRPESKSGSVDNVKGGEGNDNIFGGGGNDRLSGDSGRDRVLGGFGNDILAGGTGDDKIHGEVGNDTLAGGAGADLLDGGLGADRFSYTSVGDYGDRIKFFDSGDKIVIAMSALTDKALDELNGGLLGAENFRSSSGNSAQNSKQFFMYRTTDDTLWYDADGSRAKAAVMVADLDNNTLITASDILIV
jgi:Ca2+-binding RTX toxin-like protein